LHLKNNNEKKYSRYVKYVNIRETIKVALIYNIIVPHIRATKFSASELRVTNWKYLKK